METTLKKIMNELDKIDYGFCDENGFNLNNDKKKWDNEFYQFYYLLSPEELQKTKCGVCWDQVELERSLFKKAGIEIETYFICTYDNENLPSHTFLTYEENGKFYWFEHSWFDYKGIHEYDSKLELLRDVKHKFIKSNDYVSNNLFTFIYEYNEPKFHITCEEFYEYMETQKLVKVNEPLYFYHLVNKDSDLSIGLLSPEYMYNHKMYDLFDNSVLKYKNRIISDWGIDKFKNKAELTREEYIEGLNIFRGDYGSSQIYFFRYPPHSKLGTNMKELLKYKDIYRINLKDEEVLKNIKDIFYGFDKSYSDNQKLDLNYYETIAKEDYFKDYDDNAKMIFANLNHISIAFKDDYCPIKFLKKVKED